MTALAVLHRHLREADAARKFHKDRQVRGNVEALIAGLKVSWLKALIREIGETK